MKSFVRTIATFTAVGVTLFASAALSALRPAIASTEDARITQITAQLLEQTQVARHSLDDATATRFLDRYLDALDGAHELFLQSDVAEFRRYLPHLAEATRIEGDTRPARIVFNRYLQRVEERAAFMTKALAEEKFDFTAQDRFRFDRENAPHPRDMNEAHTLWRQRLRADILQEKLTGANPEHFARTLTHRYDRQVQIMKNLSADTVLEIYLNALAHVYDPHSDYLDHEDLENFNIEMNLSLAGVGATLQSSDDGICNISELVPGGPAAASGKLKVGDRIVAVSQGSGKDVVDLVDLPLLQVVEMIRGPKGTDVTLTIIPAGAGEDVRKTVTIRRDEIHLSQQEAKARIVDLPQKGGILRLGIIDLPTFYAGEDGSASATVDVAQLIDKLEKEDVTGIILDLRRNGGGSLEEAIQLTGLFIPSGPVVQTRDRTGHIGVDFDEDGQTLYAGPLIVLTSRFSASASEIVAGALQDYGRAVIVGDSSTFGKGTVQTMLSLDSIMRANGIIPTTDPGALKVTISTFYRPGGSSTQLRGVRPDIVLPSMTDMPEISEAGLQNPLSWDAVPAALYPRFHLVEPYIAKLRENSSARIAADQDFQWLEEDLSLMARNRASKSVSLNEAERRKQLDEAKERVTAREAERRALREEVATTYEITVENAAQDGLPTPLDPTKLEAEYAAANDGERETDDALSSTPAEDLQLRETERILADYVELFSASGSHAIATTGQGYSG